MREYLYNHDNEQQYMLFQFVDDGESKRAEYTLVKSRMMASKKRAVVSLQFFNKSNGLILLLLQNKALRHLEDYDKPNILNVTYLPQEED